MWLVASPDYLARAATLRTVADLVDHDGIPTRTDLDHWMLDDQSIRVRWAISTGNMSVTYDAACPGLGIALVPGFLADAAIAAGRLVRILPESRMDQLEVTALQARSVAPSITVRARGRRTRRVARVAVAAADGPLLSARAMPFADIGRNLRTG